MNAYEIIKNANYDLDHNKITLGEWEKRIEPTKNAKPIVYGHWILADEQNKEDVENDNYRFICSECQCSDIHSKKTKVSYCWNCGADMRGE